MAQDFYQRLTAALASLSGRLNSEKLSEALVATVCDLLDVKNCLLIGIQGNLRYPLEQTEGWRSPVVLNDEGAQVHFSSDVIDKAVSNAEGTWIAGSLEADPSKSQQLYDIRSCMAARMSVGDKPIGAIYCDSRGLEKRRFETEDAQRLKLVADCLAVYVDRLYSLYRESEAAVHPSPSRETNVLIGESPVMMELKKKLQNIAKFPNTDILLLGESGAGKEVIASLIHLLSSRASKPLVVINSSAIPKDLLESELFGHVKGAFTGATQNRLGKVQAAEGGTLVFDEAGDLPPELQPKLLRLLQNKTFYQVGRDTPSGPVDVRFIFATNQDLEARIAEGTFREDLYYRLRAGEIIKVPSLSERFEDVPLLAGHFALTNEHAREFTEEAIAKVSSVLYWPGNVRGLKAFVERCCRLAPTRFITREIVEQELADLPGPARKNLFLQLREGWEGGRISRDKLQEEINARYAAFGGRWSKVARGGYGCSTEDEVKSFQNWIYNRIKSGDIDPPPSRK